MKSQQALNPLLNLSKSTEFHDRSDAAEGLALFGNTAVKPLINLLKTNPEFAFHAHNALVKIGKTTVNPLISALNSPSNKSYSYTVETLGKLKDARAVEPLLKALKIKDNYEKTVIINALSQIKHPKIEKTFMAALRKKDLETIANAYPFFIQKGKPNSEKIIIRALNEYGNENIALALAFCGNNKLENAALSWSRKKGQCLRCCGGSILLAALFGEYKKYQWGKI